MAFIKRFESASIAEDIESCKDIIETLVEYENDITMDNYNIGYYTQHCNPPISHKMTSEEDKKAIEFNLFFNGLSGIKSKSDFDNYITLMQRAKSLYSKFQNYCKGIIISMEEYYIHFILTFEEGDVDLKLKSKINNIYNNIREKFEDYNRYKTISILHFNKEHKDLKEIIHNQINKNESGQFRFSLNINIKENILITPTAFKFKGYSMERWAKIKPTNDLLKIVLNNVSSTIKDFYFVSKYKDSIEILTNSDNIEIKVNL